MAIKVNTDLMESKASYASSLASQLKGTASEINYIYFGLDAKIKNRESIGSSLLSLQIRMDKLQRKMHNISDFLTNTASGYRSAEARVQSSLANVKFMNSASEKKSEPAKGKKKDKDEDKKWYQSNWFKLTVGAVVVGAAVAAAVLVGGPVLVGLAVGAVIGAGVGGVIGGISSKASGGEFIDGFSDGAMWGSISGAITGAAGAAGLGIKGIAAVDGAVDSLVYAGQTMQNGGDVTATGVATSFVTGAGFSALGAVASNKISGFMSNRVNAATVKPEIKVVSSAINIKEVSPLLKTEPDAAFFWSGRTNEIGGADRAAELARTKGGTTLESTITDKKIEMPEWDFNEPSSIKAWEDVSAEYAKQVSGEVRAVVGEQLREGNIWQNVELPKLIKNPNVTKITTIDPEKGIETIIFER